MGTIYHLRLGSKLLPMGENMESHPQTPRHHSYHSIYPMVAASPLQLNDSTPNLSFHPRSLPFVLTLPFLHGNPRSPLLRVLIHYPVLEQFTPGPPRPPLCSRTPDHLTPAHPLPPCLFSPCF